MQMNLIAAADVLPATFFQPKRCLVREFADAPRNTIPELAQPFSDWRNMGVLKLVFS